MTTLLHNYPVPRAAYDLFLRQATGSLRIRGPMGEEILWFQRGAIAAVQRPDGDIPLLEVAVEAGFLKPEMIPNILRQASNSCTPPCRCLTESNLMQPERVTDLLREVLLREFGRCSLSTEPPVFTDENIPENLELTSLNTFAAIFHFFAFFSTPQHLVASEAHYQQVNLLPHRNLAYMLPSCELPPHIKGSLTQWEKSRSLSDLYILSGLNQRELLALLSLLELVGALEMTPKPSRRPDAPGDKNNEAKPAISGTVPRETSPAGNPMHPRQTGEDALSPIHRETLDALRSWQEKIKHNNPFEILGVTRDATDADIKHAYAKLARVFHPDRLMGSPREDLVPLAEKIFAQIGNAFQTLNDKALRDEIVKSLDDPDIRGDIKRLDMRKRAALDIEKTRVLFRRGDYRSVIGSARRALALFPYDTQIMAMLAYSLFHTASDKQTGMVEAVVILDRAISLNPTSEHAHYYKGLLARLTGDTETARKELETVLSLNPKHPDARQQLANLDAK